MCFNFIVYRKNNFCNACANFYNKRAASAAETTPTTTAIILYIDPTEATITANQSYNQKPQTEK